MANKGKKTKKNTPTNTPHNTKKRRGKVALESDMTKIVRQQEYLEFITFMALPRTLRREIMGAETHEEYSKKLGVHVDTLGEWKKRPGFWTDVVNVRREFFRARSADVMLSLETKCLDPAKVSGADAKVYLTYTGEYVERNEQEHIVPPELQEALDRLANALK